MWRCALFLALLSVVGCGGPPTGEATAADRSALSECPVQSVQGIDVYDGQGDVDWDAVAGQGLGFAVIKATQGTYDEQATFAKNWAEARRVGLLRSAYHFFDPTEDGVAQADHFLAVVGVPAPDDLPATVDLECPDGDPDCLYPGASGTADPLTIAARVAAFLTEVQSRTGKPPIVYTFYDYVASNGLSVPGLAGYPLFLADPSEGTCFDVPAPWSSAALRQYSWTGHVSGIATDVDRDVFLGTAADLDALTSASSEDGGASRPPDASPSEDAFVPAEGAVPDSPTRPRERAHRPALEGPFPSAALPPDHGRRARVVAASLEREPGHETTQ
jgi:lysozyme